MPPGWTVGGDYKPPRFSEQEIDRFKERQEIAKASPLRKNTLLPFSLPSLYPQSIYDSTLSFPQSPNPLRQPSQSLLNLLSGTSSRPVALKLIKGLRKGSGRWAQVWRAEIDVEGRKKKVVVKLYAESLFPIPVHPVDGVWQSGDEVCKREADAYQSFRSTQGRDVPVCYGFFNFTMPWNKTVKGVILEDLTKIALQLSIFGRNFKDTGNGFEERDSDDELDRKRPSDSDDTFDSTTDDKTARSRAKKLKIFILRLFESQRRLQSFSHGVHCDDGFNVLVLRSSTLKDPYFVFLGFSSTAPQAEAEEALRGRREEFRVKFGARVAEDYNTDSRKEVEREMVCAIQNVFGESTSWAWREMELFTFIQRF